MLTQIRPALLTDIPALVVLEDKCFTTDQLTRANFYYFIKVSRSTATLVITHSEIILGSAVVLMRKNSKTARLYSLAIDPNFRQQGLAHQLCDAIENAAMKQHYIQMVLEVRQDNTKAINFYKKRGYEIFAEYADFYEDGEPAFRMRKPLPKM